MQRERPEDDAAEGAARLAADLRLAAEALAPLSARFPAARAASDLLQHDLLPRCGEGTGHLVCGIVGPNNAGKSALFNALCGRDLSPSEPTGGATRSLVGAAHPRLLEQLQRGSAGGGFRVQLGAAQGVLKEALEPPEDPYALCVAAVETLPDHVLLIDTPDFDSVLAGNRGVSEALVAVADVVVAVVTRHSYQNRAVVEFFQEWLRHRRPWMLVYNEAIDEEVARSHAEKLVRDIGTMPIAAFWAPHRVEIQQGAARLEVEALLLPRGLAPQDGESHASATTLRGLLFDVSAAAAIKQLAFRASLARLRDGLAEVEQGVAADASDLAAVRGQAEVIARELGVAVAHGAMPLAPFLEAFRVVLDRRSNLVSRNWRALVRGLRLGVESLARLGGGGRSEASATNNLASAEVAGLERLWPEYWERLARDLGAEARAPVRRRCAGELAEVLDEELSRQGGEALARARQSLAARAADFAGFQRSCEALIDDAIEERGFDFDIQLAADLVMLAPAALAAAVIVTTGGIGADLAVAGGGAAGTLLLEKYAHVLGSGITRAARHRWTEFRGGQIAAVALEASLPRALALADAAVESDARALAQLAELRERFA